MKKNLLRFLCFVIGFGLIGGITYLLTAPSLKTLTIQSISTSDVLVRIVSTNDSCLQKGKCPKPLIITNDGTFTGHVSLTPSQLSKLRILIKNSNLNSLSLNPRPLCPSASGKEDISFAYPTKYGETLFTLCQISNPNADPLLNYTASLEK